MPKQFGFAFILCVQAPRRRRKSTRSSTFGSQTTVLLLVAAIVLVLAVAAPWFYWRYVADGSTEGLDNTIPANERPRVIGGMPRGPPLQSNHTKRQKEVVAAFKHAWKAYKMYAWGKDELRWQIEYTTGINSSVPSPVWGFQTQSFPDLVVTDVNIPNYAFSGQQFDVSWTVINQGNISTRVHWWYDAIYIGRTLDFSDSRRVRRILQNRFVDPEDGYVDDTTVDLRNDDIGNYYVFVVTDLHYHVSIDIRHMHN